MTIGELKLCNCAGDGCHIELLAPRHRKLLGKLSPAMREYLPRVVAGRFLPRRLGHHRPYCAACLPLAQAAGEETQ